MKASAMFAGRTDWENGRALAGRASIGLLQCDSPGHAAAGWRQSPRGRDVVQEKDFFGQAEIGSLIQSARTISPGAGAMRRADRAAAIVLIGICMTSPASGQEADVLGNADIVTLTEAGLSAAAIVAVIEASGTDFDISVAQLAVLAEAGVESAVIEAMARTSVASRPGPVSASGVPSPAAAQPGQSFSDTLTSGGRGPEMVVIPPGRFRMGCVSGQECWDNEFPVHDVTIPQAFAVSKYEVTFEDYDRYTYPNRVDDAGWGRGRRPVINVSWNDAQDYVEWLSAQTGHAYRLLSEAEWEYVARAGSSTVYSWGTDIGSNRANCDGCGSQWDDDRTAPVGSFAPNAFGVHDMHGNVWEWVEDCWNGSYAGAPTDGSAWRSGDCERRAWRGGAWYVAPRSVRSAVRSAITTGFRYHFLGFRVARTLTP